MFARGKREGWAIWETKRMKVTPPLGQHTPITLRRNWPPVSARLSGLASVCRILFESGSTFAPSNTMIEAGKPMSNSGHGLPTHALPGASADQCVVACPNLLPTKLSAHAVAKGTGSLLRRTRFKIFAPAWGRDYSVLEFSIESIPRSAARSVDCVHRLSCKDCPRVMMIPTLIAPSACKRCRNFQISVVGAGPCCSTRFPSRQRLRLRNALRGQLHERLIRGTPSIVLPISKCVFQFSVARALRKR